MKKFLFTICLILCLTPLCAHAAWYDGELAGLRQQGFIDAAHFDNPDSPILREEICDVLVSLYKFQNPQATIEQKQNSFTDTQNSPYKTSIDTAYSLGLINGTSETTFDGTGTLTREQFATIIYRMHGSPLAPVRAYRDEPKISEYALCGIDYCVQQGIVKGTAKDYFSPKKTLTKAEALVMVNRLLSIDTESEDAQILKYIVEDSNNVYIALRNKNGISVIDKSTSERRLITFEKSIAGQVFDMGKAILVPITADVRYSTPVYCGGYIYDKETGKITEYDSPIFHHPLAICNGSLYFSNYNGTTKENTIGKFNIQTGEITYGAPFTYPGSILEYSDMYGGDSNNLYGKDSGAYGTEYYLKPFAFEIDLDTLTMQYQVYSEARWISFVNNKYTGYSIYEDGNQTTKVAIHDTETGTKLKEIDLVQFMDLVPNEYSSYFLNLHAYLINGEIYLEDVQKKRLVCLTDEETFDICVGLKSDESYRYNIKPSSWIETYSIDGRYQELMNYPENNLSYSSIYNRKYYIGDAPLSDHLNQQIEILKEQKHYWTTYKNPTELIKAVNKYLTNNCVYDYDTYKHTDLYTADSYLTIGVIRNKKAVCGGYADYFEDMLTYAGIPAKMIMGSANGDSHAWNLVYLNGNHYYFDCTQNASFQDENSFVWRSLSEVPHIADQEYIKYLK